MTLLSQQDELQAGFYAELVHGSLKTGTSSNVVLRRIKSVYDSPTQILNELGTTDIAIGDATAEIMITTLGKIPNEMYYLEDTTPSRKLAAHSSELNVTFDNNRTTLATIETTVKYDGYTERSTLLIILLTTLLIILLICCVTACVIARSRSRQAFFTKSDVECSPGCGGVNQPLLEKASDTTSKTSSTNN